MACEASNRKNNMECMVESPSRGNQHAGALFPDDFVGAGIRFRSTACDAGGPFGYCAERPVFAEFERAMIVERINSGLARAKAKGVKRAAATRKTASGVQTKSAGA